ncbi:fungal-specific transcription factor-like protein [Xylaria cf. heliscus]|nr:fungal-specific transcription factor-like protein [Xylaria cf. heliscus]
MNSPTNEDYGDAWSHAGDIEGAAEPSGRATKRRRTDANGGPTRERGIMRDGHGTGLPRFIGSGSGIHLIRTVYDVLARSHTDRGRDRRDAAADVVPGEEDQLTGPPPSDPLTPGALPVAPFWQADEISGGSVVDVSFDTLLQWTESYFKYWHPIFPLLHGPAFLGTLEQVSQRGIEALSPADAIVVRSVLSISLADSRQVGGRQQPFPQSLIFFNQEDIATSVVFVLSNPASIKNIQAALCVELFLISMLKFNMASRVGGIIVRMAFNLGLHRCPGRFPNFGAHDASMRKRLWWSIYCLDRVVCQTLGLPLGIRDDDIDVCLPSEELHGPTGGSQSNGTALQTAQRHEYEQLQLLIVLSKHARLRGMILELRNKSIHFRYDDPERALRVQAELKRWINEVYDLTSTHSPSRNSPSGDDHGGESNISDNSMHPYHKTLLCILQHELIISLHRPLLASDLGTASSQAAFQECINASKAIIDTAASNSRRLGQEEPDMMHGHLLWPSLTWSVWMSCFVLTYAAIEGVTTAISAKRYANRALRVLKLLSLRKTSWPEKCTLAVEQLIAFLGAREESNKGHSVPMQRSQRRPSIARPRQPAETAETPSSQTHDRETSQAPNPSKSREESRWSRPTQLSLDGPSSATHQFQSLPSSTSSNPPGTTSAQEFSLSSLPGFTSNPAIGYPNPQVPGEVDHLCADPLIALDFANFAQGSSAQGMIDFNFDLNGFG